MVSGSTGERVSGSSEMTCRQPRRRGQRQRPAGGEVGQNRIFANGGGEVIVPEGAPLIAAENDVREDLTMTGEWLRRSAGTAPRRAAVACRRRFGARFARPPIRARAAFRI
jgi:hypothetical protein